MKMATGKVIGGKVVPDGVSLKDGASVAILTNDDEGSLDLTPDQVRQLLLSIEEVERGEAVPAHVVLARLARRHG